MRNLGLAAAIALLAFAASGQTRETADSKLLKEMVKTASVEPYRKAKGQVYDLTPRFRHALEAATSGSEVNSSSAPCPEWCLCIGRVSQVLGDGTLLRRFKLNDAAMQKESELVFIKNLNLAAAGNYPLAVFVVPDGRHSFAAASGARKTVNAYDLGTTPSAAEVDALKPVARHQGKADRVEPDAQKKTAPIQTRDQELKDQALRFWVEKAKAGDASAQLRLGAIYLTGEAGETNLVLAEIWLKSACTNGEARATNLLERMRAR